MYHSAPIYRNHLYRILMDKWSLYSGTAWYTRYKNTRCVNVLVHVPGTPLQSATRSAPEPTAQCYLVLFAAVVGEMTPVRFVEFEST